MSSEEVVEVRRVRLCDLFPQVQITNLHREYKHQTALQLVAPTTSRFGKRLHDALNQLFTQTTRRHRRLAIEDDEFFHADKVQRVEQARKYSRDGTRLYQPFPSRKKPLSTLLKPSILSTDKKFTLKYPIPATAASMPLPNETINPEKTEKLEKVSNAFPGSIPVSLMEIDIPKLYDGAYYFVWAPKTNGLRFFAVGCHFGHEPWLLLVNRSQQVFALPGVTAPDVLYDGTVLDGELVPTTNGRFAYLAYDCAMSCGVPCSEYNYLVRLQIASVLIESWKKTLFPKDIKDVKDVKDEKQSSVMSDVLIANDDDPRREFQLARAAVLAWNLYYNANDQTLAASKCEMDDVCILDWRVKRVYSPERLNEMLSMELGALDHDTDGFMSTAVEPPIQIGQTQTIFKIKRATDHTIDFLAVVLNATTANKTQPLIVDLVAMHNKGLSQVEAGVLWDTVEIPVDDLPLLAHRLGHTTHTTVPDVETWLHGKIVECRYNWQRRVWEFEYVRLDKNAPNKLSTADKTWKNVQENLSLLQIFPEGSMTDAQRQVLREWELKHPQWRVLKKNSSINPEANLEAVITAPVPLKKLITFN